MTEKDTHPPTPAGGAEPAPEYPGMPRWVKVSGIITIGLVLLVVVVLVVTTALGLHTPGGPGGHGTGQATPFEPLLFGVTEGGVLSSGGLASLASLSGVAERGMSPS